MPKNPKQVIYEHLLEKLNKIAASAIRVDFWENCPLRRPGGYKAAACNLGKHENCPGWEGKVPDGCPLRKGAILVELEEAKDPK